MKNFYSFCEIWPGHLRYSECLLQVKLLADIDTVDEFLYILPFSSSFLFFMRVRFFFYSSRKTIFDRCEITGEVESCSIFFLEDTGRKL